MLAVGVVCVCSVRGGLFGSPTYVVPEGAVVKCTGANVLVDRIDRSELRDSMIVYGPLEEKLELSEEGLELPEAPLMAAEEEPKETVLRPVLLATGEVAAEVMLGTKTLLVPETVEPVSVSDNSALTMLEALETAGTLDNVETLERPESKDVSMALVVSLDTVELKL